MTSKKKKRQPWPYWLHIDSVGGDLVLVVRDLTKPRSKDLVTRISAGSLDQLAQFARRPGEPIGFSGVTYTMTTMAQMKRMAKTGKIPPLLRRAYGELAGEDQRTKDELEKQRADIEQEALAKNAGAELDPPQPPEELTDADRQ